MNFYATSNNLSYVILCNLYINIYCFYWWNFHLFNFIVFSLVLAQYITSFIRYVVLLLWCRTLRGFLPLFLIHQCFRSVYLCLSPLVFCLLLFYSVVWWLYFTTELLDDHTLKLNLDVVIVHVICSWYVRMIIIV
jgi:hypothetical protein